jgi:Right handed beta helix region
VNKFRFIINALAAAIFMLTFVSIAQAQATRTWVSGVGDDANPCSRTAPCKTFAGAISKTADCGEIDALDPGGFGAVTITKSITIDGTGTLAGILASLTTGIIINAPSDKVITLRGLSIDGACNGIRGINIIQAKTVNVEDCVIFRFTNEGILVNESNDLALNVRNTVIRDNTGDGLSLTTTSSLVKATLQNCSINGNLNGIHALAGSRVNASHCVISNNSNHGVFADAVAGGSIAVARVWVSQIAFNGGSGVQAGNAGPSPDAGVSVAEIAQDQINNNTGNGVLLSSGAAGTAINTFSNSSIVGNGLSNNCAGCTLSGPGL